MNNLYKASVTLVDKPPIATVKPAGLFGWEIVVDNMAPGADGYLTSIYGGLPFGPRWLAVRYAKAVMRRATTTDQIEVSE